MLFWLKMMQDWKGENLMKIIAKGLKNVRMRDCHCSNQRGNGNKELKG